MRKATGLAVALAATLGLVAGLSRVGGAAETATIKQVMNAAMKDGLLKKVNSGQATDAEKKAGVVGTVFLKDRKDGIQVTKATAVHRQMGKLVPIVGADEIKAGSTVSVWVDAKTGAAEGVLIFP